MTTNDSTTRGEAIRQHWKHPERVRRIKATIRACILADWTAKATAMEAGLTDTNAARWARALGFRRMYVTDAERAQVMAARAAQNRARAA
jgi:hypothetical protein